MKIGGNYFFAKNFGAQLLLGTQNFLAITQRMLIRLRKVLFVQQIFVRACNTFAVHSANFCKRSRSRFVLKY